jgi:hypothetical protein
VQEKWWSWNWWPPAAVSVAFVLKYDSFCWGKFILVPVLKADWINLEEVDWILENYIVLHLQESAY